MKSHPARCWNIFRRGCAPYIARSYSGAAPSPPPWRPVSALDEYATLPFCVFAIAVQCLADSTLVGWSAIFDPSVFGS